MFRLLRKDLVVSWKAILVIQALWLIQWLTVLRLESLLMLSAFATAILPLLAFGIDDSSNGDALICSLPVRRSDVVRARYLLTAILGVAGLGFAWLVATVAQFVAPDVAAGHGIEFTKTHAGGFLLIVMTFTSITIPFLFRSGFRRGIIECGFAIVGIGVVMTLGEYVISLRDGYAMFEATPFIGIARALGSMADSFGLATQTIAVAVLAGLVAMSMVASTRFYEARDL
jgi:ABC-2 type transport system permease protein